MLAPLPFQPPLPSLFASGLPSKKAIMFGFGVSWPKAVAAVGGRGQEALGL